MTEHERKTWQQNDYDPKFIETEEGLRIARAFEEAGAEQIVAEHNAFGELMEAAFKACQFFSENDVEHLMDWEDSPHLALSRAVNKAVGKQ